MDITTISLGFVNCYLVMENGFFVLIDTGIPFKRNDLEKALSDKGCVPGKLKLIVLTHGDIDHSGNCAYLMEKFRAKIAIHSNDSSMVEKGDMAMKRKVKSSLMRIMHIFMARSKTFQNMINNFEKFKPDIYLEDGQSLSNFGFDLTILHIPGHTDGSIAILAPDGSFFCGDTLQFHGKIRPAAIITNEEQLKASIERIKNLKITTVYPGHGKPFTMGNF